MCLLAVESYYWRVVGLNFRCHLFKKRLAWFSISWSCLSESSIKVIRSLKSRLTIIKWLCLIPSTFALISTFSWSIKSGNLGLDNGLACRILSSMLIASVWSNFVAIVILRFYFNLYIILHSFPLIPRCHSK